MLRSLCHRIRIPQVPGRCQPQREAVPPPAAVTAEPSWQVPFSWAPFRHGNRSRGPSPPYLNSRPLGQGGGRRLRAGGKGGGTCPREAWEEGQARPHGTQRALSPQPGSGAPRCVSQVGHLTSLSAGFLARTRVTAVTSKGTGKMPGGSTSSTAGRPREHAAPPRGARSLLPPCPARPASGDREPGQRDPSRLSWNPGQ